MMKHFLEGITQYINQNEKSNKYKSPHESIYQSLSGALPSWANFCLYPA